MAGNLQDKKEIPPGIVLIGKIRDTDWSRCTYTKIVCVITFIAYASYHAQRIPINMVKSMDAFFSGNKDKFAYNCLGNFNGKDGIQRKDGTQRMGMVLLDFAFLLSYACGTYIFGPLGDTWDLRLLLAGGMVASGISAALPGLGYFLSIHALLFYIVGQLVAGFVQATGWPCVVAVICNWLGGEGTGLIMGVWNAHSPVGNIIGFVLAARLLRYGWGWSFLAQGAIVALAGVLVFLLLTPNPTDLGFNPPTGSAERVEAASSDIQGQREEDPTGEVEERSSIVQQQNGVAGNIGIFEALTIPGMVPFALSLFFMKLVSHTFMYWLPFYLSQEGDVMSVEKAGNASVLFDVGGLFGGIVAGYISDRCEAPASTAAGFMFLAIPSIALYPVFGRVSQLMNFAFFVIAGFLLSGSNALITTAVSADLSAHSSLRRNSRALATVAAVINGTGSIGAALGPILTWLILPTEGWNVVFGMLALSAVIAMLVLSSQVRHEVRRKRSQRQGGGEPMDCTETHILYY